MYAAQLTWVQLQNGHPMWRLHGAKQATPHSRSVPLHLCLVPSPPLPLYRTTTQIKPALPEAVLEGAPPSPSDVLTLAAPGQPDLRVPLALSATQPLTQVIVWEWTGAAADEGEEVAGWLSTFLGRGVRLVSFLWLAWGGWCMGLCVWLAWAVACMRSLPMQQQPDTCSTHLRRPRQQLHPPTHSSTCQHNPYCRSAT